MPTTTLTSDFPLIDGLGGDAILAVLTDANYLLARGVHRHPHGEFFLLRSGYLKSQTATGSWLIPAGHLCWIPPFAIHGADTDNTKGDRIYLAPAFCDMLCNEPCIVSSTPLILAVIDRLISFGETRTSLSGPQNRLLGVLCDEIERTKSRPIVLPMPQDARLRRIADRWLQHPDDQADLDDLAVEAGMSRRSFTRNFKADTGVPVGEWRQVARLIHGIDMLAAGKSVTEAAFALGYDSMSSFVLLCQRHTGMSPKMLARAVRRG
jgi:AraC-like DNA-binding protein